MICKNCKHFNQTEYFESYFGWCDIEFPSWLYKEMKIDRYAISTTVRVDDSCSFFEAEK